MRNRNGRCRYYKVVFLILFVGVRAVFGGPARLNRGIKTRTDSSEEQSILGSHVIYVSPEPGAMYVTPVSDIIVRSDEELSRTLNGQGGIFEVIGTTSGIHEGNLVLSDDERTLIFKPEVPFSLGERVRVLMSRGLLTAEGDSVYLTPYSFTVSRSNLNADRRMTSRIGDGSVSVLATTVHGQSPITPVSILNGKSRKHTIADTLPRDFPALTVTASDSPNSGYLFLASFNTSDVGNSGNYLMIVDNNGNPVYYRNTGEGRPIDFSLQPTGVLTYFDESTSLHYVMNASMDVIDSITCGNGYVNDPHELRILPDGRCFLLCDDYETVDMSKVVPSGDTAAIVTGNIIQELDKYGNVVFQWRSWDHFNITDAIGQNLQAPATDYEHANAIEIDPDGNILLSSRHLSEITKIDVQTGDIIWRLGGKNNQFTFVNDPIGFSYQHSIRRLPNGDITLFDDGNLHTPPFSRGVEYKLDEVNKTATLVWQYRHDPDVYGYALGYVQRFTNGNTLIGWGAASTTLTEVKPDGSTALEMSFPRSFYSYRVYRYPFLFVASPRNTDTIYTNSSSTVSWNSSGVDSVNVDYSTDGGMTWNNIVRNYQADSDSISWLVPNISASSCKIRITESGQSDMGLSFESDSVSVAEGGAKAKMPAVPLEFGLEQNYPNPFNPSTTIKYQLARQSDVSLKIYSVTGELVKTLVGGVEQPGYYTVKWNGENNNGKEISSGVYFYQLEAGSFESMEKMLLLK